VDIWAEWADEEHTDGSDAKQANLGPVYGYLWRSFGGAYPAEPVRTNRASLINQIQTNPDSRRLIVTGWDPHRQTR